MKKSNFALRLQPSLMEEAKKVAKAEGVGCLVNFPDRGKRKAHADPALLPTSDRSH